MKDLVNLLKKHLLVTQLLIFFLLTIFFFIRFHRLPPEIPLFFSQIEGNSQIADSYLIFLPPILSFLTIFINNLIINRFFQNNPFFKKLIFSVNFLLILLSSFIFLKILFLVT